MKRIAMLAALCLLMAVPANAQNKAETRLYKKAVSAATVKAYEKYLHKYPQGAYAAEISAKLDTLTSISPYSPARAHDILEAFLPSGAQYVAFGRRKDCVDRIHGICVASDGQDGATYRSLTIMDDKGTWTLEDDYTADIEDEGFSHVILTEPEEVVLGRSTWYNFSTFGKSADGNRQCVRQWLYDPAEMSVRALKFEGRNILSDKEDMPYHIEGRSDENMAAGMDEVPMRWLLAKLKSDKALDFISDGDYLTDYAIEKWLEANPDALTKGGSLKFSILPVECSLVEVHLAKKAVKSSKYTASMFDYRGYTVIIAYNKEKDEYYLAWVEPECKNHYRDRLLNAIVFDGATTLEMQYYHGQRFYKKHLGLASKKIG